MANVSRWKELFFMGPAVGAYTDNYDGIELKSVDGHTLSIEGGDAVEVARN